MYIGFHVKNLLSLPDLNETEYFGWIFEKYSNNEFHENPSGGSRGIPTWMDGETERHDRANSRFSQFYERS